MAPFIKKRKLIVTEKPASVLCRKSDGRADCKRTHGVFEPVGNELQVAVRAL